MSLVGLTTVGAWLFAASGVLALVGSAGASLGSPLSDVEGGHPPAQASPIPAYQTESLASITVARDLFRVDRRPAPAYDPGRASARPSAAEAKPTLVLSGIVWGDPALAIIEGIPGRDGPQVLRTGDVVASLTVRRIEPHRVVVVGRDTTWTLTVREP